MIWGQVSQVPTISVSFSLIKVSLSRKALLYCFKLSQILPSNLLVWCPGKFQRKGKEALHGPYHYYDCYASDVQSKQQSGGYCEAPQLQIRQIISTYTVYGSNLPKPPIHRFL